MRALLFNLSCFNYTVASALPRLLAEAGAPDVLLLNEIPLGVGGALERALGSEWSGARAGSKRFVYVLPFQFAIYVRAPLRFEPLGRAPLGRGCYAMLGRLAGGSTPALVGLAHLTAEWPFGFGRWHAGARAREVERVIGAVRPHTRPGEPVLLGGDFNYARRGGEEPEHARAAARLLETLDLVDPAAASSPAVPAATWPSPGTPSLRLPPQRFDLFYVSRSLLPRVRELTVPSWPIAHSGSDHLPVMLRLDPGIEKPPRLAPPGARA